MFQLLSLWTQYVEIIYMPESEIHVLSAVEKMDARPEDAAYGVRTQEQDIKNRINTLFSKMEEEEGAEEQKAAEKDEDYETVNEGMTTDTTEASSHAARRGSVESEAAEASSGATQGAASQDKEEVQEGILSSDEEDQSAVVEKAKAHGKKVVFDKPLLA